MKKPLDLFELNNVTGGFAEANPGLPTAGKKIKCPKCHTTEKSKFSKSVFYDPKLGSVEYMCGCGCKFVCYHNKVYLHDEWKQICNSKGIKYGFL